MYLSRPSCQSTKIKKNGLTQYGKQNHNGPTLRCKCCSRQFVLDNNHTKTDTLKTLVKKALKERPSKVS